MIKMFLPFRKKGKTLIPLRGKGLFSNMAKVAKIELKTSSALNEVIIFPPSQAGLRFLPFIREGRKQQKNAINPVNPVKKTNVLSSNLIAENVESSMTLCMKELVTI
jgi:hypothetical protein